MQKQDILLHHPFESFAPVIQFYVKLLVIRKYLRLSKPYIVVAQTLKLYKYWLKRHNGKEVTAVIELRARFDEESNIEVANVLQEAGAVYMVLWAIKHMPK
jgi:polyphosphate kinase